MRKSEEQLIAEAYKAIYTEQTDQSSNIIQQVIDAFKSKGWKTKLTNETGIAEFHDEDKGDIVFDIFFYLHGQEINFYAHAKMPWDGNIQENDIHLTFNGEDELSIPLNANIPDEVNNIIDDVISQRLPESPNENDINKHNEERKSENRRDRDF